VSPILGIYASQISGHLFGPTGAYDSIATVTVGAGGATDIEFTSIPATYTHLQIRGIGRTTSDDDFRIQINGDTGANYSRHLFYGTGSSVGTGVVNNDTKGNIGSLPSASSTFCGYVVDILDYANTSKYKTVRSLGGFDANGSGTIDFFSSLWMNTNAITSIKIYGQSYNFTNYSSFALYGIKGGN
jgi:hypothetical protein